MGLDVHRARGLTTGSTAAFPPSEPAMGLRQRQTTARRGRILDAAGALIRKTGGTDFTMVEVANEAAVSPATPYNLFGSKSGLLYALLNRSLDEILRGVVRFSSVSALEHPLEAADAAAELFARDPVFYRPLFLVLLGVRDDVHRPRFMERSLDYWRHSLEAAAFEKRLGDDVDPEELSRALLIHFAGVLELWIHGDLDDVEFRAQVTHGTALHLLALAEGTTRARLRRRMREAKRRLPRRFSFLDAPSLARAR
jgi:AcrR family transcriptional regulator